MFDWRERPFLIFTQRFYPALRETSSGETRFTRTPRGPLDPLKHQIDIADLQDTRDLFAFDRLVLDPDGDGRVTRHLLYFDRIVLLESGMLRELDKEQWLDELN